MLYVPIMNWEADMELLIVKELKLFCGRLGIINERQASNIVTPNNE